MFALFYSAYPKFNWIIFRDLYIYITLLLVVYFNRKIKIRIILYLLPLFAVMAYSFANSQAPLFAKLAAIRQIITPFILIFIAFNFTYSKYSYVNLAKFIVCCGLAMIAFGFIERFTHLWTIVDITKFFEAKSIAVHAFGYPFIFIEPISLPFFKGIEGSSYGVPRMVSLTLDPINFGHTLVTLFALLCYEKKIRSKYKYIMLGLILVSLALTFSKGSILQLVLLMTFFNRAAGLTFKVVLVIAFGIFVSYFIISHPGFWVHFQGFIAVFDVINSLGHGLANYGNYSAMFNLDSATRESGIRDSYWSSWLGQIGVVGFLAWLFPFCMIIKEIGLNHYLSRLLVAQVATSALSENAFNLLSVAFLMLLMGSYYGAVTARSISVQRL